MKIKKVSAQQIRILRHKVLRQGKPFSTTAYQRDNCIETFHLAFMKDNVPISCATFYPENTSLISSKRAYRLRGMATIKEHRKKGYGKKIMSKAIEEIKKRKGNFLWCNARLVAVEFYKKLGFSSKGEQFNISDIGPHYFMYKKL
ncbi:MAG: GNAT family N-acetyltransferase [Flavobacteriales bacterium]|nr:GNAT family N-acetyltransferase [Flavobacteriales bacterium]